MTEWQPFETAPKDRPILVWRFDDDYDISPQMGMAVIWFYKTQWVFGRYDPLDFIPTHWMELPEEPEPRSDP